MNLGYILLIYIITTISLLALSHTLRKKDILI